MRTHRQKGKQKCLRTKTHRHKCSNSPPGFICINRGSLELYNQPAFQCLVLPFFSTVLNNFCLSPVDLSLLATLYPPLSCSSAFAIVSRPVAVLLCSLGLFIILSAFWHVSLPDMVREKKVSSVLSPLSLIPLLPFLSLPLSHLSLPALCLLSVIHRRCQSFFTPAASGGGGGGEGCLQEKSKSWH